MSYPYGADPKWMPRPGWRRALHRLELWLVVHRHIPQAEAVRQTRHRLGRRFGH